MQWSVETTPKVQIKLLSYILKKPITKISMIPELLKRNLPLEDEGFDAMYPRTFES